MAFYIGSDRVIDSADNLTYQSSGGRGFENLFYYGSSDSADYGVTTDNQVINGTLNNALGVRATGEGWRNYYDGFIGASPKFQIDLEDLYIFSGVSHREDNTHYFNMHDVFSRDGDELTNLIPTLTLETASVERTSLYAYVWRGLSGQTANSGWERNKSISAASIPLLPYSIDTSNMNKSEMINFEVWVYNALDANILTTVRWKAMFISGGNDIPSTGNGNIWIEGFAQYRNPEKHTKVNLNWGDYFYIDSLIIAGAQADYSPT